LLFPPGEIFAESTKTVIPAKAGIS